MHEQIRELIESVEELRMLKDPIENAWNYSLKNIELPMKSSWYNFVKLMLNHEDLKHTTNSYHNNYHAAEAIISSSYLMKNEMNKENAMQYGPILFVAMMFHDVAHTGGVNNYEYELEIKAINSMKAYFNDHQSIKNYWNINLEKQYFDFNKFIEVLEKIILETEFKVGVKNNIVQYKENPNIENKLKLLANESDILISCTSILGPERSVMLQVEQKQENLCNWNSRLYFLENLVKFESKASLELGIKQHIMEQVAAIKAVTTSKLNAMTLEESTQAVLEKINTIPKLKKPKV